MSVYSTLKVYNHLMLHFFFKRIKISGKEKVPLKTPKIFVTNHQNAFLDAIILGCKMKEPIHYLTRGSVFKKPFVRWLLSLINMMPIYRIRDGIAAVKKNDEIFEYCISILEKKGNLLIFAEGNHGLERNLRALQKGIGRIAFEAERRNNFNLNIQVVPVGMNYDKHWAFRNNFFMNIGNPFPIKNFEKSYSEDPNEGMNELLGRLKQELEPLILTIKSENYKETEDKWLANRKKQPNLEEQFKYDQDLIHQIESGDFKSESEIIQPRRKYYWLDPFYWYAAVNHFLPFFILKSILKGVKDKAFWASIKFALGYILVPLFYAIQFSIVYYFTQNILLSMGYLISLPIVGLLVYDRYKSDAL